MVERQEFKNEAAWYNRGYLPHYDVANKYQMITYRLADSLPKHVLAGSAELHSASNISKDKDRPGSAELYSALIEEQEALRKRKLIEKYLDQGYGSCLLRNPTCAQIILDAWKFFDGERYDLIAYVVMPNHVHLLIKTYSSFPIGKLVQSWKVFTAKEIRAYYTEVRNAEYNSAVPGVVLPTMNAGYNSAIPGVVLPTMNAECNSAVPDFVLPTMNAECNSAVPGVNLAILKEGEAFWQREYWDRFIRDEKHYWAAINYIHENPVKANLCKSVDEWPWSTANKT